MNTSLINRETWMEIRLDYIKENIKKIKNSLPPSVKFMAAVKANAYGHGDLQVSKIALDAGADLLGVAIFAEALALRRSGVIAPILVLTPILPCDVDLAIAENIMVSVYQTEWLKEMRTYKKSSQPLKIHLKLDTGLGRIGIREQEELEELLPYLRAKDIMVEGVFTHFATANREDATYFNKQYDRFLEMIEWIKMVGIKVATYHCANSATVMQYPEKVLDMVRVGVGMFGIYLSNSVKKKITYNLTPALSLYSTITHVKQMKPGSMIGYDNAYKVLEDEWIATVPIGYADGWFRCFQGFYVLVEGERCPIVGTICMDQMMIRLPRKYPIGTRVTLIGKDRENEITLEDLATHIGSVPQEIPSMITNRVPRIYYDHGNVVEVVPSK